MMEVSKIIRIGVWACVPTHLHLVPEIHSDRAVKDTSILMVDNIIDELTEERKTSRVQHFIDVKKILENK
jgi:isopentenyl phosphate kinase